MSVWRTFYCCCVFSQLKNSILVTCKVYCTCLSWCVGYLSEAGKAWNEVNWWFYFFAVCRYSITDEGRKLAEKLKTVTADSLSPVSTSSAAPFIADSVKSPSHASIDLTSDGNLDNNHLSAAEVSRDFKPREEKVSSSHGRFTRVTEREEEFKPVRCGLRRTYFESGINCLPLPGNCCKICEEIASSQAVVHVMSITPFWTFKWIS